MNLYPIPFDFIDKNIRLSWCEVKWGYENSLITSEVPVKKAEKIVLTECYTKPELELSFIMPGEKNNIDPLLKELCSEIKQNGQSAIRKKWLYIVLSWLWKNQGCFDDPLGEVENIYAHFDYPGEIEGFIKYMPPNDGYDPSKHTEAENINHLMDKWRNYLVKESNTFMS
ncbi:DUF2247 family protein [Mixta tenebrionis]|uniref:DUF2247 family protein n=1 Tax=Mixta tenebrionis TaxID=2562439 RepID=A0A506V8U1_9GAMM|nr:DUF2247 family protein [Mixta tenebrionis]TPW41872.1 DUF2247 family protein [Mixta tenebrionis]